MSSTCPHLDLFNPGTYSKGTPFEQFKELRQQCPISQQHDTVNDVNYWAITKREDLDFISKNPKIFSSEEKLAHLEECDDELIALQRTQIINMDPPKHIKYRRIVRNAFTSKAVEALTPFMENTAKEIIDKVVSRGECEFVSEVSAEMPLLVICAVLGMPAEDRIAFSNYVDTMLGVNDPSLGISDEEAMAAMIEIFNYSKVLAEKHRANPQDNVIAALLDGVVEGESLTEEEFSTFFLLLIVGGIETTRTATSQGMRLLMENPDQLQKLVDDPSLIPGAIEEILRFNPSFYAMRRTAMEDVELGGNQIKQGDKVVLYYPSANHDEDVFGDDSGQFDVTRAVRMPELKNEHRTFGVGQHFCLGSHLARKEMVAMFEEIIPRLRNPKFAESVDYLTSNFISGIKEMKITFDPE